MQPRNLFRLSSEQLRVYKTITNVPILISIHPINDLVVNCSCKNANARTNVMTTLILSGLGTGASWLCYYKALQLGDVSKECLEKGLEAAKPWGFIGDIAEAVQKHAEANGYSVVREFGGHGIGLEFHEAPFRYFMELW